MTHPKEPKAEYWWRLHLEDNPTHRPGYALKAQIDGVERFLRLEPRARVLDLACGTGRGTLELARRGYRVMGLDSLDAPISEAQKSAKAERLNAHFTKCDTRQIPYRHEFDAVVNLFASFGTLAAEGEDLEVLESVKKSLKPRGKLLMDLLNKEWLMRHFEPNFWEPGEDGRGAVVLDQLAFDFETGRLQDHRVIVSKDGTRTPSFVSLRVYTLTELKALLSSAGLDYLQAWGSFDGAAYGMDSPRMIVLAERPPDARSARRRDDGLPIALRVTGRGKKRR